jgi:hypothetical protein
LKLLFSDINPEWLEGCIIPVSRPLYPNNERKVQVMLDRCVDVRPFTFLPLSPVPVSFRVDGSYVIEETNADNRVETVQAFPSSTHRKENHMVTAAKYTRHG